MSIEKIGKYLVKEELGKGAMGIVYKALDPSIGRYVAIKTIGQLSNKKFNTKNEALTRFKMEAQSAGKLRHPNIITIFDANIEDELAYIVMDYVEGQSLDQIIKSSGKLHPHAALYYLKQLCSALDAAMEKGVVHRDIKPANIMVDQYHNVFLLDFGVAALNEQVREIDPKAPIVGTPAYMSPEQIKKEALDHRSDMFSLAIVAFQMLSGSRPFTGKDYKEVLGNIVYAPAESICSLADVPQALDQVFTKVFAKNPNERYPTFKLFFKAVLKTFGLSRIEAPRALPQADWKKYVEEQDEEVTEVAKPQKFTTTGIKVKIDHTKKNKNNFSTEDNENSKLKKITIFLVLACIIASLLFVYLNRPNSLKRQPDLATPNIEQSSDVITIKVGETPVIKNTDEDNIKKTLADPNASESQIIEAMRLLVKMAVSWRFEFLAKQLNRDSYVVRSEAIKLLLETNSPEVEAAILPLLAEHDPLIRGIVAKALKKIASKKSIGFIEQRLREEENSRIAYDLELLLQKLNEN